MPGQIRGVTGVLRWSYYDAATVTRYTITRIEGHWSLSATIANVNVFNITQRPLFFHAPHPKGMWHWEVRSHQINGDQFVASLGPPVD